MLKNPEKITYEQIKQTIEAIPSLEDRALASFAYATGARVSELLQITPADLYFGQEDEKDYLFIICVVLKKRKLPLPTRKALVRLDEEWLIKPMVSYANMIGEGKLFNFCRATAHRHLIRAVIINGEPINPHGFRKLRATHLRRYFNFDSYQLKKFFDWASIKPSEYYVGLDSRDIMY
ncbi:MAG: site-specific integrase [Magnetococcus sp. YQC-3]